MMTKSLSRLGAKCAALVLLTTGAVSCGLENQSAPALTGPSEFGLSLTLRATPDTIVADGASQSAIQVTARGPNGNPLGGVAVALDVFVDRGIDPPRLTQSTVVTDASGLATAGLIAPAPPQRQFGTDPIVTVTAVPVGTDIGNASTRTVQVRVRAPEGLPPALRNTNPIAAFSMSPGVAIIGQDVVFNAQDSMDEGERCLSRCTYKWDFGDSTSATGMTATHRYAFADDAMMVTLTVTDDLGGVDVAQQTLQVYATTGLRAMFSVNPESPAAGSTAIFDASASRTDPGTVISSYAWDFGDGRQVNTSSPTIEHSFGAPGRYPVTLRVSGGLIVGGTDTYTLVVVVR